VPAVTAKPAATGDDDAALTADNPTPDAPQQPAASATATPTAFAALVDQKLAPATATAAEATPTAQQPAGPDPYNVAGQIVDNARLITRAANSEMVIKLKPEHLGELTLKIAVDNGTVSATFHTASAEVRSAIEASLPQLRQDMASQGLKVDYVGVYASLDHFFANDQRHAPQQQQVPTARRQGGDESYTDAVAAAAGLPDSRTAGGIDYRV
jgi:flagellar hook-length control protein FliK